LSEDSAIVDTPDPVVVRYPVLRIGEGWFDVAPPATGVDLRRWRMWSSPQEPTDQWTPFDTLRLDLTRPQEELFARFNSTTRNEVRRADRDDGLRSETWADPDAALIGRLLDFFEQVGPQPGQRRPRRRVLSAFASTGRLHLMQATFDGRPLVWHAYLVQDPVALLLHSYSAFRTAESNAGRQRYSRANRWLHWQDMQSFRAAGCTTYDWGGYYGGEHNAALQRIDAFKAAFGAVVVRLWERTEAASGLGHGYLRARAALARRRG
jgi:hypothetical protein